MELFAGRTSTLTIENQKRPNLIVYKHDADTGEPIANTVFEVRAADGHSVDQIKTDSEGKAELKNLLPGVYEISEKSVPSPYLLDAPLAAWRRSIPTATTPFILKIIRSPA